MQVIITASSCEMRPYLPKLQKMAGYRDFKIKEQAVYQMRDNLTS